MMPLGIRLQISKALHQLNFATKALGRELFRSLQEREQFEHDLQIIRAAQNLAAIGVNFLGHDNSLLYKHEVRFQSNGNRHVIDSARGVEVPWVPKTLIGRHDLWMLELDDAKRKRYADLLQIAWETVQHARRDKGSSFTSDHAEAITRCTNSGNIWVDDACRHEGVITHVSQRGYGFAFDTFLNRRVFCHVRYSNVTLRVGDRVTFVVVRGRKGLQARNIQYA
jgi:cold shock CspA family protein